MRIAIDCRSVFPGMGGIGHHTANLVRALAEVDGRHQFALLATTRKGDDPVVANAAFQELTFEAGMIDELWEQVQLPSVLADNEIELYHSPCFALPVVKTTRWRIVTVHDVVFRVRPDLVDTGLCDYLDRWTEHSLDVADAVIAPSEFSKQEIVRAYGTSPDNVHVVYNGVGNEFRKRCPAGAKTALRKKLGLPQRFVLYVGSLEPKKNIDRLLQAFGLLVSEGRAGKRKLVLVGGRGGQDYDVEAAVERAGVAEHVVVSGYLEDDEVPTLMAMANLFVYPSLYEGFGLPPLEAMACRTPTVVSDATCLPEIVGDGALIAPAEDAERLAEQMDRGLHDQQLRKTLASKGAKRAREFTWERAAQQTLAIYDSVAEASE